MTMSLISHVTVGADGAAAISFTDIPQSGTDLLLLISGRSSGGGQVNSFVRFNGDDSANYKRIFMLGYPTNSIFNNGNSSTTDMIIGTINPINSASNTFGNLGMYISGYASSGANGVSSDSVSEDNNMSNFYLVQNSGSWSGPAPITSLQVTMSSSNFLEHTTASLYKITEANNIII
jgi:hypothetical protein